MKVFYSHIAKYLKGTDNSPGYIISFQATEKDYKWPNSFCESRITNSDSKIWQITFKQKSVYQFHFSMLSLNEILANLI